MYLNIVDQFTIYFKLIKNIKNEHVPLAQYLKALIIFQNTSVLFMQSDGGLTPVDK